LFGSVLVGTDGSERAERAVHAAVDIAKALDARLVLVAAFRESAHTEMISGGGPATKGDMRAVAEQMLLRSSRHADEQGLGDVEWEARRGHPADVILDIAIERKADLIVVGNKGMTGARRYVLGGVADKISHHAPCSVMIVRTD
jgi:nucleotide-binding universal stress UspA family protein